MKKIGIDARLYSQTGVGTYLNNLLFYLDKYNNNKVQYYIYLTKEDFDKVNFKSKNIIKKLANYHWHSFSEQIFFLFILLKDNLDLVHFTYFGYPVFYFKKFIATVHDLTPIYFKTGKASTKNKLIYNIKHLFFRITLFLQIKNALRIIVPAKTIKEQLINLYGNSIKNKIDYIYEGINYQLLKNKENKNLIKKYSNFFIYVGNFYPHKNVERLVEAFIKIKTKIKLLLIGPDDYFTKKMEDFLKKIKSKNILIIKKPKIEDLLFFYKYTKAIIHPSLSEGFGLTLVEAAYFNKPIIASNIDIFKELWGNKIIYFDPYKTDDIKNKIENFINNSKKIDYCKVLKKFSFKEMTKKTLNLYNQYI